MSYLDRLVGIDAALLARIDAAETEMAWLRAASGNDLLMLAASQLGINVATDAASGISAVALGDMDHGSLVDLLEPMFEAGTNVAADLADQVQLARAFADPASVTVRVARLVQTALERFPRTAEQLRVGSNPGDVLDPFILAANYSFLSGGDLHAAIGFTLSHKVLMKIEDLSGNLHQDVVGAMRGNFRVPEPQGTKQDGKELLHRVRNPFPGADVGQVPLPERPGALRLFQVKSKTGSAKGGDGKRLGEQLQRLQTEYGADTFYAAVVGNTLRGHRSKGAVLRESPDSVVVVGEAALNEMTQSAVGGELLLRTYQRAFSQASAAAPYNFSEIAASIAEQFELEAMQHDTDSMSALLHESIGGDLSEQDSRFAGPGRRRRT